MLHAEKAQLKSVWASKAKLVAHGCTEDERRSKTYSDHGGSVSFQKVLMSSSATRKTGAPPLEIDTA